MSPRCDEGAWQLPLSPRSRRGRGGAGGGLSAPGRARHLAHPHASIPPTTPRVGLKSFPQTLPLEDHEVVLTFDDGPWPATTPRVLAALAQECVRATFFLIGKPASEHPALVRRIAAEGHTIGHHTWTHHNLKYMKPDECRGRNRQGHCRG